MDQADSIIASVDDGTADRIIDDALPADLTAEQKTRIAGVARKAYFGALANGDGPDDARAQALDAVDNATIGETLDPGPMPGSGRDEHGFALPPEVVIDGVRRGRPHGARGRGGAVEREVRDFYRKPFAVEAFRRLEATIAAEEREDVTAEQRNIGMTDDGRIADARFVGRAPGGYAIEGDAFAQLVSRLGYGGAKYLAEKCPPALRAQNVNAQAKIIGASDLQAAAEAPKDEPHEPARVVLRTRRAEEGRSIFAAVSPGYGAFDADLVASALREATPAEARGGTTYDGRRSRFEVWFQTEKSPKHFAAGETFRAGVVVTSSDDAGGAIRGQSVAWQSACTNLCIISVQALDAFAIRHVGSVLELARKFKGGFAKALQSLETFLRAWDYATEDDLRAGARSASDGPIPEGQEDLMRGVFRGLVTGAKPVVRLPGRRKLEEVVDALIACWRQDESSARAVVSTSRASAVNAVTRYAHEYLDELDPWAQDEIVQQASGLLWGRRGVPGDANAIAPKPLAFVEAEERLEVRELTTRS